jgi:hypothetical protein
MKNQIEGNYIVNSLGGLEMSDTDAALDDYPMEDEGWVKCHHCGGSGLTIEGWDCNFCDGTGELEI